LIEKKEIGSAKGKGDEYDQIDDHQSGQTILAVT
jgi:hypothetical protein